MGIEMAVVTVSVTEVSVAVATSQSEMRSKTVSEMGPAISVPANISVPAMRMTMDLVPRTGNRFERSGCHHS